MMISALGHSLSEWTKSRERVGNYVGQPSVGLVVVAAAEGGITCIL